jgi:FlaG/FlaF family flagellin (archaellin)
MDNTNNTEGSVGPVIATIIILVVVVLGGLYFWGQRTPSESNDIYGNPVSTQSESTTDTSAIDTQSNSNNPASIDADLKSTDIDGLGAEINAS